jgi:hypothetical protein
MPKLEGSYKDVFEYFDDLGYVSQIIAYICWLKYEGKPDDPMYEYVHALPTDDEILNNAILWEKAEVDYVGNHAHVKRPLPELAY